MEFFHESVSMESAPLLWRTWSSSDDRGRGLEFPLLLKEGKARSAGWVPKEPRSAPNKERFASISGGSYNTASGIYSSVSAGFANRASGEFSTVGGGTNRTAPAKHSWTAGTLPQDK